MTILELIGALGTSVGVLSTVGLIMSNQFKKGTNEVKNEVCKLNKTVEKLLEFWNNQQVTNQATTDKHKELEKEIERINKNGCEQRHNLHK